MGRFSASLCAAAVCLLSFPGCTAPGRGNPLAFLGMGAAGPRAGDTADEENPLKKKKPPDEAKVASAAGETAAPKKPAGAASNEKPVSHNVETLRLIEKELADAAPEERERIMQDLKGVEPAMVQRILRIRRMTRQFVRSGEQHRDAQHRAEASPSSYGSADPGSYAGLDAGRSGGNRPAARLQGLGHSQVQPSNDDGPTIIAGPVMGPLNGPAASGGAVRPAYTSSYGSVRRPQIVQTGGLPEEWQSLQGRSDASESTAVPDWPPAGPQGPQPGAPGFNSGVPGTGMSQQPNGSLQPNAGAPPTGGTNEPTASGPQEPPPWPQTAGSVTASQFAQGGPPAREASPQPPPGGPQSPPPTAAEAVPPPTAGAPNAVGPGPSGVAGPVHEPRDRQMDPNFAGPGSASPPPADASRWNDELQTLISLAESAAAQSTPGQTPDEQRRHVERHVFLRMLYLIAGRQEQALEAIPGIAAADQEFWQQMFWAVANYFHAEAMPDYEDRATQTIAQLRTAIQRLQENARLELRNVAFCHKIASYGNYEPFERDEFRPGQPVLVYAEVTNFKSEPADQGRYRTVLKSWIEIHKAGSGGGLVEKLDFPPTEDFCRNSRRDYFHSYEFTVPKRATLGPHVLKLIVEDQLSRKVATYTLNFTVK